MMLVVEGCYRPDSLLPAFSHLLPSEHACAAGAEDRGYSRRGSTRCCREILGDSEMRLNVAEGRGYRAPVVQLLPPALVIGRYWCSETR